MIEVPLNPVVPRFDVNRLNLIVFIVDFGLSQRVESLQSWGPPCEALRVQWDVSSIFADFWGKILIQVQFLDEHWVLLFWALNKVDVLLGFEDLVFGCELSGWVLLKGILPMNGVLKLESPFVPDVFSALGVEFVFDLGFKDVFETVKVVFFGVDESEEWIEFWEVERNLMINETAFFLDESAPLSDLSLAAKLFWLFVLNFGHEVSFCL
jgi:hypothetical protein